MRALEIDVNARYQSTAEMASDLERTLIAARYSSRELSKLLHGLFLPDENPLVVVDTADGHTVATSSHNTATQTTSGQTATRTATGSGRAARARRRAPRRRNRSTYSTRRRPSPRPGSPTPEPAGSNVSCAPKGADWPDAAFASAPERSSSRCWR